MGQGRVLDNSWSIGSSPRDTLLKSEFDLTVSLPTVRRPGIARTSFLFHSQLATNLSCVKIDTHSNHIEEGDSQLLHRDTHYCKTTILKEHSVAIHQKLEGAALGTSVPSRIRCHLLFGAS